jgi:hypothetical protein
MDTYSYVLPNIQQPAAERMDAMGWAERLWVRTPNPEGLLLNVIQDPDLYAASQHVVDRSLVRAGLRVLPAPCGLVYAESWIRTSEKSSSTHSGE